MKTKISYRIKLEPDASPVEIAVDIKDIENGGLQKYLMRSGLINQEQYYEVMTRRFITSQKKVFHELPSKSFKVNLHSVDYFKNNNFPQFVEVKAPTKGVAMMTAMNQVGLRQFPDGWRGMEAMEE